MLLTASTRLATISCLGQRQSRHWRDAAAVPPRVVSFSNVNVVADSRWLRSLASCYTACYFTVPAATMAKWKSVDSLDSPEQPRQHRPAAAAFLSLLLLVACAE